MNRFIILFLFSLGILSTCVFAVEVIPLNEGWNFHRGFQAPASEIVKVTLPHTWNAGDGMFGNADYYRGLCNYSRKLSVPAHYRGKRFFLKVMAAQTVADIFIDHYFVMQHKGGYTAFVAELTDFLVPGKESVLEIRVSNAHGKPFGALRRRDRAEQREGVLLTMPLQVYSSLSPMYRRKRPI